MKTKMSSESGSMKQSDKEMGKSLPDHEGPDAMAKQASGEITLHIGNRRMLMDPKSDFLCGLFRWHPTWLQLFANKHCFLILFCLTSVLQGVYYTYFVSVLTTIEKLYQMPSKTTGTIMSSTEIGQISGALLLTYYGGQGHRPRWIATGMVVFACAALLCSSPHYLFGSQPIQDIGSDPSLNPSLATLCKINNNNTVSCNRESEVVMQRSRVTNSVLGIFFTSLLMIGLGTTAVNTLGIPYIDDNVAPRDSPLYFSITIGTRVFGPVFGFLLGSLCTSIPVQFPFGTSELTNKDPNWIGAWWLGLFVVGIFLSITAIPMMIFPRRLPKPDPSSYCHQQQQQTLMEQEKLIEEMKLSETTNREVFAFNEVNSEFKSKIPTKNVKNGKGSPSLSGFPSALRRLLTNDILLCRTASSVLHILPISGLYTFLPKYLESQFQLTASDANMICGLAGIFVIGIGIFASGIFMRIYNPGARFVAKWIAFAAISYVLGMVVLVFLGCPTNQYAGVTSSNADIAQKLECSEKCDCPTGRFDPVCMSDGTTYISACIAGCQTQYNNGSTKYFSNCTCSHEAEAKAGLCPLQCNTLTLYVVIFSITMLIHSTSEVGSMLLTLRCVQPQDKAMALGFISFATSLFGNVPCPIIYGAIVDSACIFWEEDCGKRGACRLYDSTRFRQLFHGLTAFIMLLAFCIDLVVCYKASAIQFHDEAESPTTDDNDNETPSLDKSNGTEPHSQSTC